MGRARRRTIVIPPCLPPTPTPRRPTRPLALVPPSDRAPVVPHCTLYAAAETPPERHDACNAAQREHVHCTRDGVGGGVVGVCEADRVCGRYANSRRPEDLVEEFEIERTSGPGPGHDPASAGPHFNVPPTKAPLLVLRRQVKGAPPQATGPGEQPEPDHPTPAA